MIAITSGPFASLSASALRGTGRDADAAGTASDDGARPDADSTALVASAAKQKILLRIISIVSFVISIELVCTNNTTAFVLCRNKHRSILAAVQPDTHNYMRVIVAFSGNRVKASPLVSTAARIRAAATPFGLLSYMNG